MAEPPDGTPDLEKPVKGVAKYEAEVFHEMVRVDMDVSLRPDGKAEPAMKSHGSYNVTEKGYPRLD
jgi:hypothetical protein